LSFTDKKKSPSRIHNPEVSSSILDPDTKKSEKRKAKLKMAKWCELFRHFAFYNFHELIAIAGLKLYTLPFFG
jgi:hypothetical protein